MPPGICYIQLNGVVPPSSTDGTPQKAALVRFPAEFVKESELLSTQLEGPADGFTFHIQSKIGSLEITTNLLTRFFAFVKDLIEGFEVDEEEDLIFDGFDDDDINTTCQFWAISEYLLCKKVSNSLSDYIGDKIKPFLDIYNGTVDEAGIRVMFGLTGRKRQRPSSNKLKVLLTELTIKA